MNPDSFDILFRFYARFEVTFNTKPLLMIFKFRGNSKPKRIKKEESLSWCFLIRKMNRNTSAIHFVKRIKNKERGFVIFGNDWSQSSFGTHNSNFWPLKAMYGDQWGQK